MGKRYETPKAFETAVKRYFNRITVRVPLEDAAGNPVMNIKKKPVIVERYVVPPSIEALALELGFKDDRSWRNYASAEGYEAYHPICEWAKMKVQAYLIEQLNTRDRPQGIIFNLTNNFGMTEKMEVEKGPKTRAYEAISLSERRALLAQTLKDMEEDLHGTAEDPD